MKSNNSNQNYVTIAKRLPIERYKMMSLMGCMLLHIVDTVVITHNQIQVFGTVNIWGNIQVYVCSYFRQFNPTLTLEQAFIMSPIQSFAVTFGNIIGITLIQKIPPKVIMTIGFSLYIVSQLASAYVQNIYLFLFFYGIVAGIGLGMNFFLPVYVGWKCFPEHRGLVTSLIFCSNGVGTIIAAIMSTLIINPDNLIPSIDVVNMNLINKYYDTDVTQNVPQLFIIFAGVETIILIFAIFCIWIPCEEQQEEIRMPWKVETLLKEKVKIALKTNQFIVSYIMMFFSVLYFQYITIVFKPFGESKGLSDYFLTIAASIGMAFNCVSRLFGGIILDKVRFKFYFAFILGLSSFLALTFDHTSNSEVLFTFYMAASYYVMGSIFVSMPIYFAGVFGADVGSQVYCFFFTSNSLSSLIFSFFVTSYQPQLGYAGMLYFTAACSLIGLFLLLFVLSDKTYEFEEKYLIDDYNLNLGPVLQECNYEFSNASFLKRRRDKQMYESFITNASTIFLRSQSILVPRHMQRVGSVYEADGGFGGYKKNNKQ